MGEFLKTCAGPLATVIAAIAAVSVTAYFARHQKAIAEQQAFTAREVLRHDLFDRRYAIFEGIFDFYEAMIAWNATPEQIAIRTKFFRSSHEARFLFRQDSGIADLLTKLNADANEVIAFKEHPEAYNYDPHVYLKKFTEITAIQTTGFDRGLAELSSAITPYLTFDSLAGRASETAN